MKGKISEVKDIKILKCNRNIHVKNVNEEMKEISSKKEDIWMLKYRRKSNAEITNE